MPYRLMAISLPSLIALLRPRQWVKNLFIFVPLFFTPAAVTPEAIQATLTGAFAFCLASSLIYIFNDWQDYQKDLAHPKKAQRPLASGRVSKPQAALLAAGLAALLALLLCWMEHAAYTLCLVICLALNVLYCLVLRNHAILDIASISASFILRLYAGIAIIAAHPSPWIVIMTGMLALFIATAKRYDDIVKQYDQDYRQSLRGYNKDFLRALLHILCGALLAAYFTYIAGEQANARYSDEVLLTAPFVVLGLMRYLQLTQVEENSGSPTELLWRDRFLQICVLGWILVFGWILYGASL